jgi:hypothetical protein
MVEAKNVMFPTISSEESRTDSSPHSEEGGQGRTRLGSELCVRNEKRRASQPCSLPTLPPSQGPLSLDSNLEMGWKGE